ncbi:MAG: replicative DNA helicase [Candidatus Omnitrophota bacterium]
MPLQINNPSVQKIPPQSIEAEAAVLGAMLIDENAPSVVFEILQENCFYKDAHRKIFSAILDLYNLSQPIDILTLQEVLKKKNLLEESGGTSYIMNIANSVPTAANVEYHARIIKEKAILRNLITAATQIAGDAYENSQDADYLLDKSEKLIFDIASERVKTGFKALKEVIGNSMKMIESLYQKKVRITGLATGFTDLDEMTSGLQASDLIIVAGRPSMGKSSLACNIAEHAALYEKKGVAIFSLEMSREQLVQRFLCSHARIDIQKVRSGFLSDSSWIQLTAAAGKLYEAPIFIDDTPGISPLELRAKARRLSLRHDIQLIIVDYLQLMRSSSRVENRQQEISEISQSLKALAKELNIPVIALSQLSRAPERREDFKPRLSDLRESGAIEQDADVVMLIFRQELYDPKDDNRGIAEINIAKQRNGPTDTIKLTFIKELTRFENHSGRGA